MELFIIIIVIIIIIVVAHLIVNHFLTLVPATIGKVNIDIPNLTIIIIERICTIIIIIMLTTTMHLYYIYILRLLLLLLLTTHIDQNNLQNVLARFRGHGALPLNVYSWCPLSCYSWTSLVLDTHLPQTNTLMKSRTCI